MNQTWWIGRHLALYFNSEAKKDGLFFINEEFLDKSEIKANLLLSGSCEQYFKMIENQSDQKLFLQGEVTFIITVCE